MAPSAMDAVGVLGLLALLGAFAANVLGRLPHASRLYQGLNAGGSAVLAVYAWWTQAWVFLPLEAVWALVATYAFVRPQGSPRAG